MRHGADQAKSLAGAPSCSMRAAMATWNSASSGRDDLEVSGKVAHAFGLAHLHVRVQRQGAAMLQRGADVISGRPQGENAACREERSRAPQNRLVSSSLRSLPWWPPFPEKVGLPSVPWLGLVSAAMCSLSGLGIGRLREQTLLCQTGRYFAAQTTSRCPPCGVSPQRPHLSRARRPSTTLSRRHSRRLESPR